MLDNRLVPSFRLLHLVYGLVPIVAGVDKFTNLLTNWSEYLAPWFAAALPFEPATFMALVGIIEIAAGILTLVKPRIGGLVVGAWLVAIALNLITSGRFLDVAVRDLVMAGGAFVLARMAAVREEETERVPEHAVRTSRAPV